MCVGLGIQGRFILSQNCFVIFLFTGLWTVMVENDISYKSIIALLAFLIESGGKVASIMLFFVVNKINFIVIKLIVHQRCQPGTTICKIMTKNPYNLQKNPYKLSTQFWYRIPL